MPLQVQVEALTVEGGLAAHFDADVSRVIWPRTLVLASLLLFICGAIMASAQTGFAGRTERAWRVQDGLPDQVIQAVAQTPDNYLWLGTTRGLVRFDGFHFVDYGADTAHALHDYGVYCILVAKDATLWLGTPGGGVVHLVAGGSHTYGAASGLQNLLVRVLYEDTSGHIWAGTDHGIYQLSNDHFIQMDDAERTPNVGVHSIIGDGGNGVWVAGSSLLHFQNHTYTEVRLPPQRTSIRIKALALGADKTLWIGTLGGLFRLRSSRRVERETKVRDGVRSLGLYDGQRLWIGTVGDGLIVREPSGMFSHVGAPDRLNGSTVLSIAQDASQDLWVGTQTGLIRLSDTGMHLTRIPGAIDSDFGSVAVDSDHSLWVSSGKLIHFKEGRIVDNPLLGFKGIPVRAAMRERSGAFWLGTLGRGAYRIAPNGAIEHYTSAIGTNYIDGFLEGHDGSVWIASDGGVANWNNGKITSYQNAVGAPHSAALAMAEYRPHELWVGTSRGLSLLQDGNFVDSRAGHALGSHIVWALHSSDDGTLWIGTEAGLFLWTHGRLRHISFEHDQTTPAIFSILEDRNHKLWLGGPTTVLRVSRDHLEAASVEDEGIDISNVAAEARSALDPEIFAVSRETGAELYGGVESTAALDGIGGAWFASNEGPLHIEAGEVPRRGDAPPVVIEKILVDGQSISPTVPVTLQPAVKTLEIDATPIVLGSRTGLQLRRRLIGFDATWAALPSSHLATYTNLPPGHYVYRVEASWRGSPGFAAIDLPITQRAYFYHRPLFLWSCALFILLLIWLYHRFQVHQMTLRFRAISEERNRVAREMHDTVVQSCIGVSSLLEGIASAQISRQQVGHKGVAIAEDGSSAALLTYAREQIATTIVEARNAIWDLRHPDPEGGLSLSLRALFDRMTATLGIQAVFQMAGVARPLDQDLEHELLMTAREALHNAIIHAEPKRLELKLRYHSDRVTISIADDGKWIKHKAQSEPEAEHFGLLGMHERMKCIGGYCRIQSTRGGGTTVFLYLPTRNVNRGTNERINR